ncbi:hypothetical protein P7K49_034444 [Saguinus oedipus]|uniref:Uncharacterized protein n=1 Tax=Saguinus oedipus TaxID=9490 RepID=A0ABQ9TWI8_SAGOE|nr:hypothetical protein P7K49_034444 [Saguinus oedipus]
MRLRRRAVVLQGFPACSRTPGSRGNPLPDADVGFQGLLAGLYGGAEPGRLSPRPLPPLRSRPGAVRPTRSRALGPRPLGSQTLGAGRVSVRGAVSDGRR